MSASRAARGAATVERLLDAVATILREEGAAAVSVQHVADVAATSKGLVHYHFTDKHALLLACADRLVAKLMDAEASVLSESTPASALDDLWNSLVRDEARGSRRALLVLAAGAPAGTRGALAAIAERRTASAARTLERLETLIGLSSRVSRPTFALAYLAFADGLAIDHALRPTAEHRKAFDAFWLAALSLEAP